MATTSTRGGTLTAKANGPRLTKLRVAKKLKQREVEVELDIPRGQLTRFETGKPVGIKYLLKLADFYEVPPKELLDLNGIATTSTLLTDLAKLHGVTIDFGTNGEHSKEQCEECSRIVQGDQGHTLFCSKGLNKQSEVVENGSNGDENLGVGTGGKTIDD